MCTFLSTPITRITSPTWHVHFPYIYRKCTKSTVTTVLHRIYLLHSILSPLTLTTNTRMKQYNSVRSYYDLIRLTRPQQPQPNNAANTLMPNPPTFLGIDNCLWLRTWWLNTVGSYTFQYGWYPFFCHHCYSLGSLVCYFEFHWERKTYILLTVPFPPNPSCPSCN